MGLTDNAENYLLRNSKAISDFYSKAYTETLDILNNFSKTKASRKRAAAVLLQIEGIVKELDDETKKFIEDKIPATYKDFGLATKKDIRKLGAKVDDSFALIHTRAVQAIADDSYLRFARSMQGVINSAEDFVSLKIQKELRETLASGLIKGEARDKISKEVQEQIEKQGVTAFIDKGGKRWQLNTYSRMLSRTVLQQAGNQGNENVLIENGFDVVKVSTHGTICPLCIPYEGKYLSLTGQTKGVTTIEEARRNGLFHPNCMHTFSATNPNDYGQAKRQPSPEPLTREQRKELNQILKDNEIQGDLRRNLRTEDKRKNFFKAQKEVKKKFN